MPGVGVLSESDGPVVLETAGAVSSTTETGRATNGGDGAFCPL